VRAQRRKGVKGHLSPAEQEKEMDIPITSVKNALANTIHIITVMNNTLGPSSPRLGHEYLANFLRSHLTGPRRNIAHATARRTIYNAVMPEEAFTSATDKASSVQPTISFPTPAERTHTPTVVSRSFNSVRIRHKTGNAVMLYATPQNNRKWVKLVPGVIGSTNLSNMTRAIPDPMEKGRIIPPKEMRAEVRAFARRDFRSISSPTKKRKRTRPIFAVRDR